MQVAELLAERKSTRLLRGGTYRYFLRGQATPAAADDVRVEGGRRHRLKAYDTMLKVFQYRKALDAALSSNDPIIVTSMLEELVARQALQIAVSGRDEEALESLLAFVAKYIIDPRFAPLLLDVAGGAHRALCASRLRMPRIHVSPSPRACVQCCWMRTRPSSDSPPPSMPCLHACPRVWARK